MASSRHRQAQQAVINERSKDVKNKFSSNLLVLTITPGLRLHRPCDTTFGTIIGVLGAEGEGRVDFWRCKKPSFDN